MHMRLISMELEFWRQYVFRYRWGNTRFSGISVWISNKTMHHIEVLSVVFCWRCSIHSIQTQIKTTNLFRRTLETRYNTITFVAARLAHQQPLPFTIHHHHHYHRHSRNPLATKRERITREDEPNNENQQNILVSSNYLDLELDLMVGYLIWWRAFARAEDHSKKSRWWWARCWHSVIVIIF